MSVAECNARASWELNRRTQSILNTEKWWLKICVHLMNLNWIHLPTMWCSVDSKCLTAQRTIQRVCASKLNNDSNTLRVKWADKWTSINVDQFDGGFFVYFKLKLSILNAYTLQRLLAANFNPDFFEKPNTISPTNHNNNSSSARGKRYKKNIKWIELIIWCHFSEKKKRRKKRGKWCTCRRALRNRQHGNKNTQFTLALRNAQTQNTQAYVRN